MIVAGHTTPGIYPLFKKQRQSGKEGLMNFFENSVFFGVTISLIAYGFGHALQGKFKLAILNPLLISVASIIALLRSPTLITKLITVAHST